MINSWTIITGDCIGEMGSMAAGSVDLIFADPPYNIGVDYGAGAKADRLDRFDYLAFTHYWIEACYRLLASNGSLWVLIGDEYAAELAMTLRVNKFHRRSWIKWYETFGVCNSAKSNFSRTSRHLFYCVKNPGAFAWHPEAVNRPSARQEKYNDKRANPDGKIWDDVWTIPRLCGTFKERIRGFPTQLPLALLEPIIGCSSDPGDLVLDPFSGSGTTGEAALAAGRRYVGIEKQEKFTSLSRARLAGMVPSEAG